MSHTLNYPTSPSYHTKLRQDILSQCSPTRHRFGTSKLREALRQQCRIRVREKRRDSFDKCRPLATSDNESSVVANILREELAQLDNDINLHEIIYEELLSEMNEWFAKQLEDEENYLITFADSNELFCPICLKSTLITKDEFHFTCPCGVSFCFDGDIEKLRLTFKAKIKDHEAKCDKPMEFFTEPKTAFDNNLSVMCEHCDYFCSFEK